jgi:hypothetical protein
MSNGQFNESEDPQVAEALRHFRESVHAWSEAEYSKPRTVRQARRNSIWSIMASPLLGWSLAAIVLGTSVGVPVEMHHRNQVQAAQKVAADQAAQKLAQEKAEQARIAAIDDDELMSHVDSDIAQDAPDAMQPLASLMNTSKE